MYNAVIRELPEERYGKRTEGTYGMDKSKEKNSGKRKKVNKGRWLTVVALVLLAAAAVTAVWYFGENNKTPYDTFEVVWTGNLHRNAAVEYIPYCDGYMKVSRDGAEAVNSYGSLAWNVSYDMNNPVAACCREYAAVGDYGNRIVYMMDGTGSLYWKNVPYPIREVETSAVGVTAVRMNDGMTDYIQLITLSGEVLVEIKTLENKDGFPVDIALSEDGTKLVTSYLVMEDGRAGGWLAFYNFGEVGQNYANNLAGVFKYEEVVPELRFLGNDTLCAFRKEGVDVYKVPELPERLEELSFDSPILQVYTNDKYFAVMTDNTKEGTKARTIVYDRQAKPVFDRTLAESFDAFLLSKESVVFYNPGACLVVAFDGSLKFNGLLDGMSAVEIMPADGKDKFMVLEDEKVSTIQLVRTKEE